ARHLLSRAQGLEKQLETLATGSNDAASRTTHARAAAKLAASVISPLEDVLGKVGPDAVSGDPSPALHALALDATRLRARAGGPPARLGAGAAWRAPPARAAGEDAAERARRRAELQQLRAALPADIQVAHDGPYLVTNVARITDPRGVSLEPLPQVAL